jgi:hypothetical protein
VPSICIWSSGIGKDIFTYVGLLIFAQKAIEIFIQKKRTIGNFITLLISAAVINVVKSYILLLCIPFLFIHILITNFFKESLSATKTFVCYLCIAAVGYIVLRDKVNDNTFVLNSLAEQIMNTNHYLSVMKEAGSSYKLGIDILNMNGIASMKPYMLKGINVTLFRPYFTEMHSSSVILNALESFIFLLLTIYIVFKTKFFGLIKLLLVNPFAMFCLCYTLVFSILVGIASGNFGTLVRYKIPCIPFFLMFLLSAYIYSKKEKSTTIS